MPTSEEIKARWRRSKLTQGKVRYDLCAPASRAKRLNREVNVKKPRAILTLGGLIEPYALALQQRSTQRDACRDAIAALADAGFPLFERMRVEGCCVPMKIDIWHEIASRADSVSHAALKVQVAVLARSRSYLVACAAGGAMRYDLDGKAVEPVTAEHRQRAARRRSMRKN